MPVSSHETLEAYSLPTMKSVQAAKLSSYYSLRTGWKKDSHYFIYTDSDMALESVMLLAHFGNPMDS